MTTAKDIQLSLCPSKTKMLTEVAKAAWSNTAYLHFASVESASVFFHRYSNQQSILNDVTFTVHATQYPSREAVKYLYK
ncbi:hypothetical protein PS15p_207424 [Mucor circinelloides]